MEDQTLLRDNPVQTVPESSFFKSIFLPALAILGIILLGIGTGWVLSINLPFSEKILKDSKGNLAVNTTTKEGQAEIGSADTSTFRDTAEGVLEQGGFEGEGTHHLVRDGGPSQYVYLTSSVIDLSQFVGKKVKVWGQTVAAQKAGWLMDVGRIKILE